MRKLKIYLETSVFNYYFDTERDGHADTVKLFEEMQTGKYKAFTSIYVTDELERTKDDEKRRKMLALIGEYNIAIISADVEADRLADIYVSEGVIPAAKRYDGLHISIATINELDCIFSFNFKHINRLKTKTFTALINVKEGYKPITIATPGEVVEHGDDE
jgi:predicted nucleic acid-binding protein